MGERPASAVRTVAAAFLGSRLVVLGAALVAENLVSRNPTLSSGAAGPLLRSLTSWDGWWYLGIVRDGYHASPLVTGHHDYAFAPLFPGLVRLMSAPTPELAGPPSILVSNGLFAVALVLLFRLTSRVLDRERAVRTCVLLCVFPFSAVFSMAYSESLFYALMLASLLAAERGQAPASALTAALAAMARLPGVLLALPLAMILWHRVPDRRYLLCLAVVPLGALLFAVFVAGLTGDLLALLEAQQAWARTGLVAGSAEGSPFAGANPLGVSHLVTLFAYVFLFVFFRADRIPAAYAVLAAAFLAAAVLSGSLESIGRYGMAAFPFIWALAGRGSPAMRLGWPVVSTVLLAIVSVVSFAGWYVP